MTKESALHLLRDLVHDMKTCQFNTYGVKRATYYNWVDRGERIVKQFEMEAGNLPTEPTPPPPPQ